MTRFGYVMVTYFAAMGVAVAAFIPTSTKLIWNATASAPIGFYTIAPADQLEVPELDVVMPPEPLADFMVERGYVGRGVPLLKRVLGLPGQRVCRSRDLITVDGIEMGEALDRDRLGRRRCAALPLGPEGPHADRAGVSRRRGGSLGRLFRPQGHAGNGGQDAQRAHECHSDRA